MPRRNIQFHAGEYYHIYNRGAFRNRIFHGREEYLLFLSKWRQHIQPAEISVVAYCLMPNHYHLLVRAGDEHLPQHMQRFGTSFVKAWNRLRERTGVAFEGEYQAIHVDEEAYLLHLTRYIHLNPVTAGLTFKPEDWEFSSYRDYLNLRQGLLPQFQLILQQFSSPQAYQAYVEARGEDAQIRHLMFDEDE